MLLVAGYNETKEGIAAFINSIEQQADRCVFSIFHDNRIAYFMLF